MAFEYEANLSVVIENGGIVAHQLEGLAQESISGSGVATIREHEVNELAMFVDRSKEILPAPSDPHVGLIHTPRTGPESLVLADPLLDLRRVALNPSVDRRWVDLDPTLLHHLRQITIADAVLAVPADA